MLPSESEVPETTWNKSPGWTGPEAVLYQSFDNSNGLVLWEGTQHIDEVPLVSGKVLLKYLLQNYCLSGFSKMSLYL